MTTLVQNIKLAVRFAEFTLARAPRIPGYRVQSARHFNTDSRQLFVMKRIAFSDSRAYVAYVLGGRSLLSAMLRLKSGVSKRERLLPSYSIFNYENDGYFVFTPARRPGWVHVHAPCGFHREFRYETLIRALEALGFEVPS